MCEQLLRRRTEGCVKSCCAPEGEARLLRHREEVGGELLGHLRGSRPWREERESGRASRSGREDGGGRRRERLLSS